MAIPIYIDSIDVDIIRQTKLDMSKIIQEFLGGTIRQDSYYYYLENIPGYPGLRIRLQYYSGNWSFYTVYIQVAGKERSVSGLNNTQIVKTSMGIIVCGVPTFPIAMKDILTGTITHQLPYDFNYKERLMDSSGNINTVLESSVTGYCLSTAIYRPLEHTKYGHTYPIDGFLYYSSVDLGSSFKCGGFYFYKTSELTYIKVGVSNV